MAKAIRKDAQGREYVGKGATLPQAVKAAEKAYKAASVLEELLFKHADVVIGIEKISATESEISIIKSKTTHTTAKR